MAGIPQRESQSEQSKRECVLDVLAKIRVRPQMRRSEYCIAYGRGKRVSSQTKKDDHPSMLTPPSIRLEGAAESGHAGTSYLL